MEHARCGMENASWMRSWCAAHILWWSISDTSITLIPRDSRLAISHAKIEDRGTVVGAEVSFLNERVSVVKESSRLFGNRSFHFI